MLSLFILWVPNFLLNMYMLLKCMTKERKSLPAQFSLENLKTDPVDPHIVLWQCLSVTNHIVLHICWNIAQLYSHPKDYTDISLSLSVPTSLQFACFATISLHLLYQKQFKRANSAECYSIILWLVGTLLFAVVSIYQAVILPRTALPVQLCAKIFAYSTLCSYWLFCIAAWVLAVQSYTSYRKVVRDAEPLEDNIKSYPKSTENNLSVFLVRTEYRSSVQLAMLYSFPCLPFALVMAISAQYSLDSYQLVYTGEATILCCTLIYPIIVFKHTFIQNIKQLRSYIVQLATCTTNEKVIQIQITNNNNNGSYTNDSATSTDEATAQPKPDCSIIDISTDSSISCENGSKIDSCFEPCSWNGNVKVIHLASEYETDSVLYETIHGESEA